MESNENHAGSLEKYLSRKVEIVGKNNVNESKIVFGQLVCVLCRDGIYRTCGVLTRYIEDDHVMHPDDYEAIDGYQDI